MSRLTELSTRYEAYKKCEMAILDGAAEYQIGSRSIKRAELNTISEMIKYLEKEIATETAKAQGNKRNKVVGVIPRDL